SRATRRARRCHFGGGPGDAAPPCVSRFCPLAVRGLPLLASCVLVVSAAGCAAAPDSPDAIGEAQDAIQGGSVDAIDEGVVGVAITSEEGRVFATCSGTLIAPNLVLTAQHCVAPTSKFVSCSTSLFGPQVRDNQVLVTTAPSMWRDPP